MAKITPINVIKGISDNLGGRKFKRFAEEKMKIKKFSFCSSLTLHYFAIAKLGCGSEEKMKIF